LCIEGVIFHMLVLGHRGAAASERENTVRAFARALADGADGVELDVRRTADGALAVHHDPALADGRVIVAIPAADLPPEVPLLAAALDACAGAKVVNVELKNWPDDPDFDPTERLVEAVVALLGERGELEAPGLLLSSFHRPTVERVRALAPGLATALLTIDVPDPAGLAAELAEAGHRALHPHHAFVDEGVVAACHEAGLAVNTWTCDDPDRLRWLAGLGVDAVVTNDPATALAALGR
jgi:glycerophosphoryl diester phosphodiesterase